MALNFEDHSDLTNDELEVAEQEESNHDVDGGDSSELGEHLLDELSDKLESWAFNEEPEIVRAEIRSKLEDALQQLKAADVKKKSRHAFIAIQQSRLPYLSHEGEKYRSRKQSDDEDLLAGDFRMPRDLDEELEGEPDFTDALEDDETVEVSFDDLDELLESFPTTAEKRKPKKKAPPNPFNSPTKPALMGLEKPEEKQDKPKKKSARFALDADEEAEDAHEVYKQLSKTSRRTIKKWCKEHPEALVLINDDCEVLAMSMTGAESKVREEIVDMRAAALDFIRFRRTKVDEFDLPDVITKPEYLDDVLEIIKRKNLPEDMAKVLTFMCIHPALHPERKRKVWPQQLRIYLNSDESDRYNDNDEGLPLMVAIAQELEGEKIQIETRRTFQRRKRGQDKWSAQGNLVESYKLYKVEQES